LFADGTHDSYARAGPRPPASTRGQTRTRTRAGRRAHARADAHTHTRGHTRTARHADGDEQHRTRTRMAIWPAWHSWRCQSNRLAHQLGTGHCWLGHFWRCAIRRRNTANIRLPIVPLAVWAIGAGEARHRHGCVAIAPKTRARRVGGWFLGHIGSFGMAISTQVRTARRRGCHRASAYCITYIIHIYFFYFYNIRHTQIAKQSHIPLISRAHSALDHWQFLPSPNLIFDNRAKRTFWQKRCCKGR
jgi:hypothetical protein